MCVGHVHFWYMLRGIIVDRDVVGVILINPGRVSSCTSNGIVPCVFLVLAIVVYRKWSWARCGMRSTGGTSVSHTEVVLFMELRKFCPRFVSNNKIMPHHRLLDYTEAGIKFPLLFEISTIKQYKVRRSTFIHTCNPIPSSIIGSILFFQK